MKNELKALMPKLKNEDSNLNKEDLKNLTVVYFRMTEVQKRRGQVLNLSCSSCIGTAYKMAYNLVTFHEDKIVDFFPDWESELFCDKVKENIPQPDLEKARKDYFERFNKAPHHKMKIQTILKQLKNGK